jgi:TonB family protein
MVKPLNTNVRVSARQLPVASGQFKDFGVLNTGKQSKASFATAIVVNSLLVAFVILIGAAATKTLEEKKLTTLTMPVIVKPVPPPVPKVLPKLPTPPVVKVDPPKIKLPDVKLPDIPKPAEVKMTQPAPVVTPAAPKKIVAPPAPQVVSLAHPMAASVVNNSPHPSAVALGQANNPIAPSNRPATSAVNLGQRGLAGMPSSNTGGGPASTKVNLGSGTPGGQQMTGNGVRPVQGVALGVTGGTGPNNSLGRQVGQVNLGQNQPPPMLKPAAAVAATPQSGLKVLYKPTPAYTPEATALHLSGEVLLKIRVSASGSVTVLGILNHLGHGLDQSAEQAIRATRFAPPLDASGHPIDWEGVVKVNFQLAS